MKKMSLEINGSTREGLVQKVRGELWVHFEGQTFCYKPAEKFGGEDSGSVEDPSSIRAPMPGKIIKIQGKVGEEASAGDVLIVMEAMKMEYNLKAAASCKVEDILCSEGEQVNLGQTLVKLEVQGE